MSDTQFQSTAPILYAPKGFLGLGKEMTPSSKGEYVKASEFRREVEYGKRLKEALDSTRSNANANLNKISEMESRLNRTVASLNDIIKKFEALAAAADKLVEHVPTKGKSRKEALAAVEEYKRASAIF